MPPAVAFVGWSGSGKTTLIARLLPELRARGLSVAAIKHSSHPHPLHRPGSDSEVLEKAGGIPSGFATPGGVSLHYPGEPAELLPRLIGQLGVDLVLIEGFKEGPFPKVEVWRKQLGPPLCAGGMEVIALVSDDEAPQGLRRFGTAEVAGLAIFLMRRLLDRPA
ncbi:MAG: molybdopterin-guanine dinucleotide biosynthesis protein B [Myxococcales bacterium]|nr:molybdopterin-guanine dinucleotide biosynthesis protein B [Myxococcales bacterium]